MLFIVGRGRSGTTLLARVLTQHPSIVVAPEGTFVSGLRRRYAELEGRADFGRRFVHAVLRERRMRAWHLDQARLEERLDALGPRPGYARACREVYRSYAEDTLGRAAPTWLGDKNPPHALLVPELAALFPEACFIHVTRDPRENVRSFLEADFDLGDPVALAWRWRQYNERVLSGSRHMPERYLHVRLEDLLARPEHELSRACALLGLAFDPVMLAAREPGPRASRYAPRGWFQVPLGPIDATRAQARHDLSSAQRRAIETICGELARGLGYAVGGSTRGVPDPRLLAGVALGALSVAAERALLTLAPWSVRAGAINAYRAARGLA